MNKKELIIISISIFCTIIAWIIVDIYHIKKTVSDKGLFKPVSLQNYEINKKIIDEVMKKKP
jgi:uncharacterized membrane protein YciS (DUF1049 family)